MRNNKTSNRTAAKPVVRKGACRMIDLGYTQVQVWLNADERQAIGRAQRDKAALMPLATLLRKLACDFADHPFTFR